MALRTGMTTDTEAGDVEESGSAISFKSLRAALKIKIGGGKRNAVVYLTPPTHLSSMYGIFSGPMASKNHPRSVAAEVPEVDDQSRNISEASWPRAFQRFLIRRKGRSIR